MALLAACQVQPYRLSGSLFVPVGNRPGNLSMLGLDLRDIVGSSGFLIVSEQEWALDPTRAGSQPGRIRSRQRIRRHHDGLRPNHRRAMTQLLCDDIDEIAPAGAFSAFSFHPDRRVAPHSDLPHFCHSISEIYGDWRKAVL